MNTFKIFTMKSPTHELVCDMMQIDKLVVDYIESESVVSNTAKANVIVDNFRKLSMDINNNTTITTDDKYALGGMLYFMLRNYLTMLDESSMMLKITL